MTVSIERLDCGALSANRSMFETGLPPHSYDPSAHAQSINRLRAEGAGGAVLVPGHDADAFAGLAPDLR